MSASDVTAAGTVAGTLKAAAAALRGVGVSDPEREAAHIWSALQDLTTAAAWLDRSSPITERDLAMYRAAVAARAKGVPAAYATGRVGFRHVTLAVDPRVLIPRPETEGLVDRVLAESNKRSRCSVLEIGVGSGAIIASLAVEGHFARLVGTDVSSEALHVARANAHALAPGVAIEWREGDLFVPVAGEQFDIIVSNPPYVARNEYEMLDHSVRCYEPRVALESGEDGMRHIASICDGAARYLTGGGLLVVEIDARRGDEAATAARNAGLREIRVEVDLFGRDRYLLARNG